MNGVRKHNCEAGGHVVRSRITIGFLVLFLAAFLSKAAQNSQNEKASSSVEELEKAEELFKEQQWAEAQSAYDNIRDLEGDWHSPRVRLAVEGAVACSLKLQRWDDALERAAQFVDKTRDSFEEAVGERFLAGLYLSVPHYGTKQGGTYLRGQWTQGVQVSSWRKDRKDAIEHYERARDLLISLAENLGTDDNPETAGRPALISAERIGVDFDLVAALAKADPYGYRRWGWIGWWWDSFLEPEEDSEAVEEADYYEPRWHWWYPQDQTPLTGIPLDPSGNPQFVATPDRYATNLGDGPKIRFLLDEIQRLDKLNERDNAAKALMRWAMIARSLYGPETVDQWRSSRIRYDRQGRALARQDDPDEPKKKVWELEEDEALTIVGGRLQVVTLPPSESPMAILRLVEKKYPESGICPEAHYTRALYLQTRQQFPEALAEYRDLIQRYPAHKRASDARSQIEVIERPEVIFGQSGVYLPDSGPKLSFTYRNADRIQFKAFEFDLVKYVRDGMEDTSQDYWQYRNIQWHLFYEDKERWKEYLGKELTSWSQSVPREEGHRVAEGNTVAPLPDPRAYVVEARVEGQEQVTRTLVLVTDIAIVQKNMPTKGLIYIADARTGQPLPNKAVRIYEHWTEYKESRNRLHWHSTVELTNEDGVVEYTRTQNDGNSQVEAIVLGDEGRMAFSFFQGWSEHDPGYYWEEGDRYYVVTDRPVYRPGDAVKFRVWVRQLRNRVYEPVQAGRRVRVEIYDARNNEAKELSLSTDEFGCVSGEFELGEEPPLGVYHIRVNSYMPDSRRNAGGLFRVEEYKKPEFEVTVKPTKTQARLGEKVKARIEARYYFGAPVARGEITYKVFRENYNHVYWGPGEYDWLYGKGYGRCHYPYPWFPWWRRWGCFICCDAWWPYPNWGWHFPWGYYGEEEGRWASRYESGTRRELRELVAQGQAQLKDEGSYEIEIDTATAKREMGDRDHRYTVEVEVRDESRRTIEGQGSVIVTRQEFYAFVETDDGWYKPKNEAFIEVRTLTADNVPVAAKGEVAVYRVRYSGADNNEVHEDVVKRWDAETDAQGRLSFKYPIASEGQYRITFKTQDSWGEEVLGNTIFWVSGPKFDGRVYLFNDLEIIANKRTYNVGETAHLLINVAENNSRILFSDQVSRGVIRDYRFLEIPSHSTVVDIPIEAKHLPNFFVEATLVRNGRVHMESGELFVPPVEGLLNVSVKTDRETYKPGEKGRVRVEVTDHSGKPVDGQVTLTVYDESITYIQDEFGPNPRIFFYGQKRYHTPAVDSSVNNTFNAWGHFTRAEQYTFHGGEPEGWRGYWDLDVRGFSLSGGPESEHEAYDLYPRREAGVASNEKAASASQPLSGAVGGAFSNLVAHDALAPVDEESGAGVGKLGDTGEMVDPEIRTFFADTALWLPDLKLSEDGSAEAEITFPQSLTTWRARGYALTNATQVGDAISQATTTKNLIVRLQSPRFFIERDEVVLSANVHNYLETNKKVTAELILPADLFRFLGDSDKTPVPDEDGNLHLHASTTVEANGEHRFDWPVKVLKQGLARITVKAMTDEESNGMRMAFPVLVHGINKTLAQGGSYRVNQSGERTLRVDLPHEIDPEQTRLEVTLSPSLAGVMIDALPYLIGYPYGCVEQTMSRFYPTVLVAGTLKKMGLDLEAIREQREQMYEPDLKNRFGRYRSPVFDSEEMDRMVRAGLQRIYSFQQSDGGWGWWRHDESSPYQTSYVLQGLHAARQAGINVDDGVYSRGMQFLQNFTSKELSKPKNERQLGDFQTQAYVAYVLSLDAPQDRLGQKETKEWLDLLYENRGELNNYGRCLLALAMHNAKRPEEAQILLRNVLQFVERDDSNETAWVRTPERYWWFWWNNDIETNAWALKAIVTLDPKNDLTPRIVKWLLNNRRNGYYWRSTRDSALVIAAMTDYMVISGEADPHYSLTVSVDGRPMKEVTLSRANLFTFDNRVLLYGLHVKPGTHEITLSKNGPGALYYSCYLSYFTLEEDIQGAGNEIFIEREYYKLIPRTEEVALPDAGLASTLPAGQQEPLSRTGRTELRAGYRRVPLKTGDSVVSGDKIEVVLKITAKNTYDYLVFEDMKPAGCEPVEVRSGARWAGGVCAHIEFCDEKVAFFVRLLEQGQHVLRYKLRAETPGEFHALPTNGFAMYAPEVKAISDEMRLGIME